MPWLPRIRTSRGSSLARAAWRAVRPCSRTWSKRSARPILPGWEPRAGVGTYAAAHIMLMPARYARLILDSWNRSTYARLLGRKPPVSDRVIERRFKRYGPYAGLAFWLFLTRDWVPDDSP